VLLNSTIVSETDLKGIITFASESFCRSSGYSKKELIGSSHNLVRHPDNSKQFFEKLWTDLRQGKTWKGVIKNQNRFGSTFEVDVTIGPKYSKSNKLIGYYALRHPSSSVISPKQNKIDEAFINYTKMLDNVTLGLVVVDELNKIVDFNNYFLKMFNLDHYKINRINFKEFYYDEKEFLKFKEFKNTNTPLRTKPLITKFKKHEDETIFVELSYFKLDEYHTMINIKDLTTYMNLSERIEELK